MLKNYYTNSSVYGYNAETDSYEEYVSDTEYEEIMQENQSETN